MVLTYFFKMLSAFDKGVILFLVPSAQCSVDTVESSVKEARTCGMWAVNGFATRRPRYSWIHCLAVPVSKAERPAQLPSDELLSVIDEVA